MTPIQALNNMIDEHNKLLEKYNLSGGFGNWYLTVKQALTELERLRTFKATFDRYELSKKQDYVAYEIMEETIKREETMKAKVKELIELYEKRYELLDKKVDTSKIFSIEIDIYELEKELKEWSESK